MSNRVAWPFIYRAGLDKEYPDNFSSYRVLVMLEVSVPRQNNPQTLPDYKKETISWTQKALLMPCGQISAGSGESGDLKCMTRGPYEEVWGGSRQ